MAPGSSHSPRKEHPVDRRDIAPGEHLPSRSPLPACSGKASTGLVATILAVAIGVFIWFFFFQTLMFSQVAGNTDNPAATIMINLLDFDTDLTRYDLFTLRSKMPIWTKRMHEVDEIPDLHLRELERQRLLAEMLQDPGMKKISRKLLGLGADAAFRILGSISMF